MIILKSPEQLIIFSMRSNPKPYHVASLQFTYSPIVHTNSNRINWTTRVYLFEMQTRMVRILTEQFVNFPSVLSNVRRQDSKHVTEAFRRF